MSAAAAKRQKLSSISKALGLPKRSNHNPDEDHPLDLWVDWDFLRKHMPLTAPKFVLPDDIALAAYNHYLQLGIWRCRIPK